MGGSLVLDSPTASASQRDCTYVCVALSWPVAYEGGREGIKRKTWTVCSQSHCQKFGVQWEKGMMVVCCKAWCWLGWVSCMCPIRMEMEGGQEIDLVTE